MRTFVAPCAVVLTLPLVAGCLESVEADYSQLGLVDVSGVVRLDGEPLADAAVIFESPDGTFCYGRTDPSGRYRMKLDSKTYGVIPGEKRVRISTTATTGEEAGGAPEEDPDADIGGDGSGEGQRERVPARYNVESELTITIDSADSDRDFDLRST